MAEPSIVTKWDFLFAWLLIGVERAEGRFSAGDTPGGAQAVAVFTDEDLARRALPSSVFDIKVISARDLLMMMPPGYGIVIDPGGEVGVAIEASEALDLVRFTAPFPEGARSQLALWPDLPADARAAVAREVAGVEGAGRVWALSYTIDDSPRLGCLVFDAPDDAVRDATAEAIVRALAAVEEAGPVEGLQVATVNIVPTTDLPDELRDALPDEALLAAV